MTLKEALTLQVMEAFDLSREQAEARVMCAIETILAQIWMSK